MLLDPSSKTCFFINQCGIFPTNQAYIFLKISPGVLCKFSVSAGAEQVYCVNESKYWGILYMLSTDGSTHQHLGTVLKLFKLKLFLSF